MNISQLAKAVGVSTDTVRYYEKQGLISAPQRQANGYRRYTDTHVDLVRFVRGAQALGFSLAEIRAILPQVVQGTLGRSEIEQQLKAKMAQIDAHMAQLKTLKKELAATFSALRCAPHLPPLKQNVILSGLCHAKASSRKAFSKKKKKMACI